MKRGSNTFVGLSRKFLWESNQKYLALRRLTEKDSAFHLTKQKNKMENQLVKAPFIGAIVIYRVSDYEKNQIQNNSAEEMPAIVTRAWGPNASSVINLKCLPDGTGTFWRTSIQHQTFGVVDGKAVMAQGGSWRWPEEQLIRGNAPIQASE